MWIGRRKRLSSRWFEDDQDALNNESYHEQKITDSRLEVYKRSEAHVGIQSRWWKDVKN